MEGHFLNDVLFYTYLLMLFCISLLLLVRFKRIDKASRHICILIWLVFLTEVLANYAASRYHNNMPVYAVYGYIEFVLISLYFNYSIDTFRAHHIGYFIALAGLVTGISNSIWYQPINTLNTLYIFLECIGIVCMSLYSFYRLLLTETTIKVYEQVHFWFPCIFLFYWCATLSCWGMYDHFRSTVHDKTPILNISLTIVNMVTYLTFGIVFLRFPKMKSQP